MAKEVITKAIVVNFLNESIGLSKRDCLNFFESFIEVISGELAKNNEVKIVNFGVFSVKKKKSRIGRNPKTKEEILITERNVVKFKPSDFLLNQVNSNNKNF